MTKDEALKLALEAIFALLYNDMNRVEIAMNAIAALRQALEQPEQEPVAFVCRGKLSTIGHCEECKPLYTAPPKREWVGLTDDEANDLKHWLDHRAQWSYIEFASAIEAKLKEKNHG